MRGDSGVVPLTPRGPGDVAIDINLYDVEEIYPNCTVQVLRNTVTGEISVGWWING